MRKRLDSRWTSHLQKDPQAKKDFEEYVYNSRQILERLAVLIKKMDSENEPFKKEDYSDPSWPYRQADHVGFNRAVKKILDLLEI